MFHFHIALAVDSSWYDCLHLPGCLQDRRDSRRGRVKEELPRSRQVSQGHHWRLWPYRLYQDPSQDYILNPEDRRGIVWIDLEQSTVWGHIHDLLLLCLFKVTDWRRTRSGTATQYISMAPYCIEHLIIQSNSEINALFSNIIRTYWQTCNTIL